MGLIKLKYNGIYKETNMLNEFITNEILDDTNKNYDEISGILYGMSGRRNQRVNDNANLNKAEISDTAKV